MGPHRRIAIDSDIRPQFTACYLRLAPGECAFVEAHTSHALPRLLEALAAAGRRVEEVRWIVVTHAHLDHAAGAAALVAACPNATLAAHPRAARHLIEPQRLIDSATAVYGAERFRTLYGHIGSVPRERVKILEDGDRIELGGATLTAWHTTGHANHHLVLDDPQLETVFTGDTFGLVYPRLQKHGRFALPSTSPTNFDAPQAMRSLDKVLALGERWVCPTHFDAWEDGPAIAAQVRRFLERAGRWVEEEARSGDAMPAMQARLAERWRAAVREEAPALDDAEREELALDVELNAQGVAVAALAKRASPSAA